MTARLDASRVDGLDQAIDPDVGVDVRGGVGTDVRSSGVKQAALPGFPVAARGEAWPPVAIGLGGTGRRSWPAFQT